MRWISSTSKPASSERRAPLPNSLTISLVVSVLIKLHEFSWKQYYRSLALLGLRKNPVTKAFDLLTVLITGSKAQIMQVSFYACVLIAT